MTPLRNISVIQELQTVQKDQAEAARRTSFFSRLCKSFHTRP